MKILGGASYGSIPHLPGSRRGPADKGVNPGQFRICCERPRDRFDTIIVQEKLDGSNVGVVNLDGQIVAVGRSGFSAASSPYEQHHHFAAWVKLHEARFRELLGEGERVCGEWLGQAVGTRYALPHEPFVAFDLRTGDGRVPYQAFAARAAATGFTVPKLLHLGGALPIADALELLGDYGHHGALEPAEGVVYRVERRGVVDFLAKFVRPGKLDGKYLPGIGTEPAEWYWRPI